jgi:hypothetical protein
LVGFLRSKEYSERNKKGKNKNKDAVIKYIIEMQYDPREILTYAKDAHIKAALAKKAAK